jgi:hypothetical protein
MALRTWLLVVLLDHEEWKTFVLGSRRKAFSFFRHRDRFQVPLKSLGRHVCDVVGVTFCIPHFRPCVPACIVLLSLDFSSDSVIFVGRQLQF